MTLESIGIPTALIITPDFMGSARAHAKVFGLPEYEPVVLDLDSSSIAGASPERVEGFAEDLIDDVLAVLMGRQRNEA